MVPILLVTLSCKIHVCMHLCAICMCVFTIIKHLCATCKCVFTICMCVCATLCLSLTKLWRDFRSDSATLTLQIVRLSVSSLRVYEVGTSGSHTLRAIARATGERGERRTMWLPQRAAFLDKHFKPPPRI